MANQGLIKALVAMVGITLTGCGSTPESATVTTTKAPTVAEVASKMQVVTPITTATPKPKATSVPLSKRGPYYESNRASQKCLKLLVDRQRDRCLDRVEKRYHVADIEKAEAQSTPEPQTIKECLDDSLLTSHTDAESPSVTTISNEYDEMVGYVNRYDTSVEAKRNKRDLDKWDDERKGEAEAEGWELDESAPSTEAVVIGKYLVQYIDPSNNNDMDAIRACFEDN